MKVLCVGNDKGLLETRCEVLRRNGYIADGVTSGEIPRFETYDVAILSATLSTGEKSSIRQILGAKVKIIDLDHIVMPAELLRLLDSC